MALPTTSVQHYENFSSKFPKNWKLHLFDYLLAFVPNYCFREARPLHFLDNNMGGSCVLELNSEKDHSKLDPMSVTKKAIELTTMVS